MDLLLVVIKYGLSLRRSIQRGSCRLFPFSWVSEVWFSVQIGMWLGRILCTDRQREEQSFGYLMLELRFPKLTMLQAS